MGPQLPVSVRFGAGPPAVIVDASLALSPAGLLAALALARTAQVWLPRGLYTLLDNDAHYRGRPEAIGGLWLDAQGRLALVEAMAAELDPWRRAWQNGRLSSRVHWVGDAQYESVLPNRSDNGLLPRFETICAAFDRRRRDSAAAPLEECARDVCALAAALQPEPAYILTLGAADGGPPPLFAFLAASGIPVHERPWTAQDHIGFALAPALAPLAASGTAAAIVQVVAPVAVAIGEGWGDSDWEEMDEAEESGAGGPDDPWRGASALWRPFAALEAAA
ncbi:MAG TPA: hypothetical protein VF605_11275 [Allosphingosinicella sp.]|jgi:hypothetical protein